MAAQPLPPIEAAVDAGLIYVTDSEPGIRRVPSGTGFRYEHASGRAVTEAQTLDRIQRLAIPPAYSDVWICESSNGHLQATGRDARRRKQYRYHERFREVRDSAKFDKMLDFAAALPDIRKRVDEDLARRGMPREKALAAVVYLLERSLIRIGNEEYAKAHKHYGLTTMLNRHARVSGARVTLRFKGKSGVAHEIEIEDRRLAKAISKTQELPGQQLFNYLDEQGECRDVTSADVNDYLREVAGADYTAKDFRTWAGTVLALTELAATEPAETTTGLRKQVSCAIRSVARVMRNTPAVCRKCYVHPAVLQSFLDGSLGSIVAKCVDTQLEAADEAAVREIVAKAAKALVSAG